MEKLKHGCVKTAAGMALAWICVARSVASPLEADSLMCAIRFRVGQSRIDTLYEGNRQVISRFRTLIDSIGPDAVTRIEVRSFASPEGGTALNDKLAQGRATSARKLVESLYPQLASRLHAQAMGEDWNGLRQAVEADATLRADERRKALAILDGTEGIARKKTALKALSCYARLLKNYYAPLRSSVVCTFFVKPEPVNESSTVPADTVQAAGENHTPPHTGDNTPHDASAQAAESIAEAVTDGTDTSRRGGIIALKTNMLYDAALIPNIGVEVPLARHGSVSANWMYAWWNSNRRHRYWRTYGGELEGRYWLREAEKGKPLSGHHFGLYAQALTFDVEWGGRGYMGGKPGGTMWQKAILGGGVSYGYSLPVTNRLNFDFALGIGYLGGRYQEYIPDEDCYAWQGTHRLRYFGPTRAEVSLVWWIGYGKYRRGGRK